MPLEGAPQEPQQPHEATEEERAEIMRKATEQEAKAQEAYGEEPPHWLRD